MAYRILIVDDEIALQNMVKEILIQAGYETAPALSCAQALEQFQAIQPDAVLLDVNLPDGDGFSLFGKLRERRDVPVLFLSARDEDADRLQGLGLGADDYITKPFHIAVLESRIAAVLRRLPEDRQPVLVCGDISLDKDKMQGYLNGEPVTLTALEYRLLHILLENKGRTLPRNLILERLWDADGNFVNDNTLTVTMRRLRKKLNDTRHIVTIRGIGYRMEEIV